jgi:hypothetical protein
VDILALINILVPILSTLDIFRLSAAVTAPFVPIISALMPNMMDALMPNLLKLLFLVIQSASS